MTATMRGGGQDAQQEKVTVEGALNLVILVLAACVTAVDVGKGEPGARL